MPTPRRRDSTWTLALRSAGPLPAWPDKARRLAGLAAGSESFGAIVEEAGYHSALLDFVRRWRRDPAIPALLRSNVASPQLSELDRVFGTMTGAFRYFCTLPRTLGAALHHARTAQLPSPPRA